MCVSNFKQISYFDNKAEFIEFVVYLYDDDAAGVYVLERRLNIKGLMNHLPSHI